MRVSKDKKLESLTYAGLIDYGYTPDQAIEILTKGIKKKESEKPLKRKPKKKPTKKLRRRKVSKKKPAPLKKVNLSVEIWRPIDFSLLPSQLQGQELEGMGLSTHPAIASTKMI